jgi:NAD(P)-dependent dehydrogenase (short-subunit alcohol dehydrogenase family)
MAGRLQDRTALVTGASSGIGAAIAELFAREGARVAMAARRADKMETIAARIAQSGPKPLVHVADVRREADILGLFAAVDRAFGSLDILVNCAGIADHTPTDELSLARWQDIIDTNLTSCFLCSREALKRMKPRGRGRIIIIGSISAKSPRPHAIGYTSTKFALDGMTRSLALDARDFGIGVSILHPGSTKTELAPNMQARSSRDSMEALDVARAATLMASLPDDTNLLEGVVLPLGQPFLGRG